MNISISERRNIFIVLLFSSVIGSIVQTALNTALAPIMTDLNIPAGTAQWLTSSYSLVVGVMVLATAFLIRRFHSRPLYLFFMAIFLIGLLLAAVSTNFYMLLIGRVFQGIGCGLLLSLTQVVILSIFPEEERGSIMGLYGLAVTAAPVLAPTLAGIIIDLFNWQMIFWGCFVLSLIAFVMGLVLMKNVTNTEIIKFDTFSMILCSVGFVGIVLGLGNAGKGSFSSASVLIPVVLGIISLVLFSHRQMTMEKPFINIRIFGNRQFMLAVITSMIIYCIMMSASTLLPLYNQSIRGFSATVSGLITMPGSLITAIVSPVAGKLYDKMGIRKLYLTGTFCIFTGHLILCFLTLSTPIWAIILPFCLRQMGIGMLMMTTVTWGMSAIDSKYTSDGTALISSLRTVAGAIGSAVFVSIMTSAAGGTDAASMVNGIRISFTGITMLSILLVFVAVVYIDKRLKRTGTIS